jgi:phage baseplate assembly protein W
MANETSELLGEDIRFTDDFQATNAGDYQVDVDVEVVRQSIYRRMVTRPGSYPLRPEYGCGVQDAVKGKLTKSTLDALHQRIVDNLAQETRIEKVVEVVLQKTTILGVQALKIYVKAMIKGREQTIRPLVFVQNA